MSRPLTDFESRNVLTPMKLHQRDYP